MNCHNCGYQLPMGATNCPVCGATATYYYSNPGTTPEAPTVRAAPYGVAPQGPPTVYESQPYGGTPPPLSPSYNAPPPSPYTPYPMGPTTPVPPPPQRKSSRIRLIVGIALLVLILIGASVFVLLQRAASQRAAELASQATATAQARANATASANATATVAAENPYTHSGKLVFTDPLRDNSQGHGWAEDPTNCGFANGAYHVKAPTTNYSDYCLANATNYTNFVFEVQLQIIQGDTGGIVFRVEGSNPPADTQDALYAFFIGQDSSYYFGTFQGTSTGAQYHSLASGSSQAINQGLNQTNIIAVVAQGSSIMIYVNHQQIVNLTDNTFSYGKIGVAVSNLGHPTEAVFSNAKVWTL